MRHFPRAKKFDESLRVRFDEAVRGAHAHETLSPEQRRGPQPFEESSEIETGGLA